MAVRMELARILIRELVDTQIIELREASDRSTSDRSKSDGSKTDGSASNHTGSLTEDPTDGPTDDPTNDFAPPTHTNAAGDQTADPDSSPSNGNGFAPETRRRFPIVIGLPEAMAIERRLKNVPIKRPQTHDLLASIIAKLGGRLESISINDLSEHTFFATLNVRSAAGELVEIDSRPSDAIALGIAERVPIYVEEHVLDGAIDEDL
ncbi:MAG: bifunctional nuclease family protein [Planctomycetota bacterium]